MSKNVFKEIADSLDKFELEEYYKTHLTKDVCDHFNFHPRYFYRIFQYYNIPLRTLSENAILEQKLMSDECKKRRDVGLNAGRYRSPTAEERARISQSNKGKKKKATPTSFKPGHVPWNKGKTGVQKWHEGQAERRAETMRKNNSFNKSAISDQIYEELVLKYGKDDVIVEYKDERYKNPDNGRLYSCDFYIPSEDLFIEVNRYPHHGGHPFDENNPEDLALLEALTNDPSEWNKAFIETWTTRDVNKMKVAKENNLNYLTIY